MGLDILQNTPASSIHQLITVAGQAELREYLTAEWDVAASIPKAGLIFRALKKVRNEGTAFIWKMARPS